MFLSRFQSIFLVLFTQLLLPLVYFYTIVDTTFHSRISGIVQILFVIIYILLIFLVGAWSWLGYYTRWFLLLLIPLLLIGFLPKCSQIPLWTGFTFNFGIYLLLCIVFTVMFIQAVRGNREPEKALSLAQPLKNGRFLIAQGGSTQIINKHHGSTSQKYALDIVKLNRFGFRAKGLYPQQKERYFIWNEPVYSPCDGQVIHRCDNQEDFDPPERDTKNPKGNYLEILIKDGKLLLAHFKKHGIVVEENDLIQTGDLLGYIGNSGNTTEPHLHIHVENQSADQEGIPIKIGTLFPKRNDIIKNRVN